MAFQKYKTSNNARSQLVAWISASAGSLIIITGEWELFPTTYPFLVTLESYNANSTIIKREIAKVVNRSSDTFTIVRSAWTCVQNDSVSPKLQNTTAYSFDSWDFISLYPVSEDLKDIKDEIGRIETDKANDNEVVHDTWDENIAWIKTFLSSPIAPTPTTDFQVATKEYVDGEVVTSSLQESLWSLAFITGENIVAWDSLFLEDNASPSDIPVTEPYEDRHWVSLLSSGTTSVSTSMRITVVKDTYLVSVVKNSSCTATRFQLQNSTWWTTYSTVNFSVDTATLATPYLLVAWTTYRLNCNRSWSSFTWRGSNLPDWTPITDAYISYIWWVGPTWASDTVLYNLETLNIYVEEAINIWDVINNTRVAIKQIWSWIDTTTIDAFLAKFWSPISDLCLRLEDDNLWEASWNLIANWTSTRNSSWLSTIPTKQTFTLDWTVNIPRGVPYWIVLFQWTYWSETINAGNYYKIWDTQKNTTTRLYKIYNGSIYSWNLYKLDNFNWTAIDSAFWTSNWVTQNDQINYTASSASSLLTNYIKSINTYTKNITLKGTCNIWWNAWVWETRTSDLVIYYDANNYIRWYYAGVNNAPMSYFIWIKIVVWWSSVYDISSVLNYNDIKIEYDKSTNKIRFYWWDGSAWIQVGTEQTQIFTGNYHIMRSTSCSWWWSFRNSSLDNIYITDTIYSTQNPTSGWSSNFLYISTTLSESSLLSKTNADFTYKLPKYPLFSKETETIGQTTKAETTWLTNNSWIIGSDYFLSNTPWIISTTPWTNKYKVWKQVSADKLYIDGKNLRVITQTMGLSPYTYQNITGEALKVMITGGTVSAVRYSRDGITFYTQATATNTEVILQPLDYVRVTYSVIPTMTLFYI